VARFFIDRVEPRLLLTAVVVAPEHAGMVHARCEPADFVELVVADLAGQLRRQKTSAG